MTAAQAKRAVARTLKGCGTVARLSAHADWLSGEGPIVFVRDPIPADAAAAVRDACPSVRVVFTIETQAAA